MQAFITSLILAVSLSLPAMADSKNQQLEEEPTSTGDSFEQWQREATESERQHQLEQKEPAQEEQDVINPGYDLYDEDPAADWEN
jgi:hypothetical protein